jgi:hypothetical protein
MHPSVLSRGVGIDFDERYVWIEQGIALSALNGDLT